MYKYDEIYQRTKRSNLRFVDGDNMKYENGSDILPEELLREVQKYASGKLIYIPAGEEKKAWGAASGYREQLQRRNRMIRNKYAHGRTVSELADEYFLSLDSIKKSFTRRNRLTTQHMPRLLSQLWNMRMAGYLKSGCTAIGSFLKTHLSIQKMPL